MKKKLLVLFLCLTMVFSVVAPAGTVAKAAYITSDVYNEKDEYLTWNDALDEFCLYLGMEDNSGIKSVVADWSDKPYYIIFSAGTTIGNNSIYFIGFFDTPPIYLWVQSDVMYFSVDLSRIHSSTTTKIYGYNFYSSGSLAGGTSGSYKHSYNYHEVFYTNFPFSIYVDESNAERIEVELDYNLAHDHEWSDTWSTDTDYHWHACTNSDGLCELTLPSEMDSYAEHVFDDDSDLDCNTCGYVRIVTVVHSHEWFDSWSTDTDYHWHACTNSDGLCELTLPSEMDSYEEHVFDDDTDPDCNTCGYTRTISSVVPSASPTPTPTPAPTNTPTPTPTPRPTATPSPTPPPYVSGGYDEDGNWVGLTEFEATNLNFLQDIKGLLIDVLWQLKNAVALLFVLVGFEIMRIVSAWIKGGMKYGRSG